MADLAFDAHMTHLPMADRKSAAHTWHVWRQDCAGSYAAGALGFV